MTSRLFPLLPAAVLAFAVLFFAPTARAQKGSSGTTKPSPRTSEGERSRLPLSGATGRLLVGDLAPDFDLRDAAGQSFRLRRERVQRPWLIIFARFPEDAIDLQSVTSDFDTLGMGAVLIAPFDRARLTAFVPEPRVRMLHDRTSRIARIYGLFDPITRNPRPGVFLVDRNGRILLIVSGAVPSAGELMRLTRRAMGIPEPGETLPGANGS